MRNICLNIIAEIRNAQQNAQCAKQSCAKRVQKDTTTCTKTLANNSYNTSYIDTNAMSVLSKYSLV